jgi:hypothetical protein
MRVGVELDDVLCEFTAELHKYVCENKLYNTSKNFIPTIANYTSKNYGKIWDKNDAEVSEIISNFLNSKKFGDCSPIKGSFKKLKKLKFSVNCSISVLTSRDFSQEPEIVEWIKNYYPGIFDNVILIKRLYPYCTNKNKAAVCDLLKIKLLIDDDTRNFDACSKLWDFTFVFYRRLWNDNLTGSVISEHKGIPFFSQWKDLNVESIKNRYLDSINKGFKFFRRSSTGNKIIIGISGKENAETNIVIDIIHKINNQFEKISFNHRLKQTVLALSGIDSDVYVEDNFIPCGFSNNIGELNKILDNSIKLLLELI